MTLTRLSPLAQGDTVQRRLGLDASAADEVLQAARAHLLLRDGHRERLEGFTGRAPLRDWLGTVVARQAFDRQRRERDAASLGAAGQRAAAALDPELALVRADHRQHLTRALEEALASLTARQRALLRLHVVERLSIDELAPMFAATCALPDAAQEFLDGRRQAARTARRSARAQRTAGGDAVRVATSSRPS